MCSTQKPVAALVTREPRPVRCSPVSMLCAALGLTVLAQSFTSWADNGNFLEGRLETKESHYLFTQFITLKTDFLFLINFIDTSNLYYSPIKVNKEPHMVLEFVPLAIPQC